MTKTLSLAPNFSWVSGMADKRKPFERFVRYGEAVETAEASLRHRTRLKPGVNGMKSLVPRAALKSDIANRK